jgi:hypothetical protein
MRAVYQAENILDAHLVRGALEAHGLRAFVTGEYLTGAAGQLPAAGLVAVLVDDADVAQAEGIVAELARPVEADELLDDPDLAPGMA